MVKYTHLNRDPGKAMEDLVKKLNASAKGQKTKPSGVKDLGESGDVVWPRSDGTAVSVRDVDLELADARQRIEGAETSLAESGSRLTAAEQAVQDVRDELAAIEVGEGGPLIHSTPPGPADGEGKPAGTAWLVYGQDGSLTSVWQWNGTAWEEMPLDAALIPVLDIGSGTFGDLEGARLVVDGTLSARVAQAMSAEVKELVVTESAVLNHVTAIGQTVVDDINVQGKLVGKDGVFTGTVDFENVNVTGELLASEISGEHLYGTVIEGGEIRTGGDESRGSFLLGDRAYVSAETGYQAPGIRFTPPNSTMTSPPGLGIAGGMAVLSGGRDAGGSYSDLKVGTEGVFAQVVTPEGGTERSDNLSASSTGAVMQSRKRDGSQSATISTSVSRESAGVRIAGYAQLQVSTGSKSAAITARESGEVIMQSGGRSLSVDDTGVWVKTNRSGVQESWNLEYTARDSGWQSLALSSAHTTGYGGAPFQYRLMGNMVHLRGRVKPVSGVYAQGNSYLLAVLPAALRPSMPQRRPILGGRNTQWGRLNIYAGDGNLDVASMSGDSDWIDLTGINWTLD